MRLLISIHLIFSLVSSFVFADPWLCGTPLLHQEHLVQHPPEEVAAAPAAPVQIAETEVTATCIAKSEHLYVYIENSVTRYAHRC